jgi:hypothetical protein
MTEKQDYSQLTTDLETLSWGSSWYDLTGRYRLESRLVRLGNWSDSKILAAKGDLTSQVHRAHQIKTGVELKRYDLDYQHYWFEFPSGDIWHLDNVFSGKPMEIAGYFQDKIEYPKSGIVANIGIRISAFNTQQKYPASIYDPLGFQEWNGGDGDNPSNTEPIWQAHRDPNDWYMIDTTVAYYLVDGEPVRGYKHFFPDSVLFDGNTVSSEWKIAVAPRIGISFPITANSKLRFNYGHFYQRPSWSKLMGFPTSWYESDPYGTVRMDQWMGWYGQPGLTWERTIQYEIGFTQNLFDVFRLDIVGYYKDASGLTRFSYGGTYNNSGGFAQTWFWSPETFSTARNAANDGHDNVFYTNNAYKDMRGVEVTLDKLFNNRWSATMIFNFGVTTGGATGHWQYNEDSTRIHQPWGFEESKLTWITNYMLKGNIEYLTPRGLGPLGLLGDINLGLYSEYFAGPQYTYYPKDYTGLQTPNNKRWYPHIRTDLKVVKRVALGKVTPVIGLEVFNLFNNFDRNMLGGDDLIAWEEGEYYTDPETGEEIKIREHRPPQALSAPVALDEYGRRTEDDIWWFYNSISNPRRMIYLNLSLEF